MRAQDRVVESALREMWSFTFGLRRPKRCVRARPATTRGVSSVKLNIAKTQHRRTRSVPSHGSWYREAGVQNRKCNNAYPYGGARNLLRPSGPGSREVATLALGAASATQVALTHALTDSSAAHTPHGAPSPPSRKCSANHARSDDTCSSLNSFHMRLSRTINGYAVSTRLSHAGRLCALASCSGLLPGLMPGLMPGPYSRCS